MHFIMVVIHIIALLFFLPALLLTVPLHIIIAVIDNKGLEEKPKTKKCPRCAEMIRHEAKVCRYCGNETLSNAP